MFRRYMTAAILTVAILSRASGALAAAPVLLGFADTYAAPDGTACVHRGVDLALDPDADVETPLDGEILFVGNVPSASGGTVLAVTIAQGDRRLTLMPLASAAVRRGQRVSAGATVGQVAATGDPSSSQPHLHVGLRKGDVYIDPSGLFAAAAAPAVEPEPVPDPAAEPQASGAPAEAPTEAAVHAASASPVEASAEQPSQISVSEPVATLGAEKSQVPVDAGELTAGVSLAGPVTAPGTAARGALPETGVLASIRPAGERAVTVLHRVVSEPIGLASCIAALAGCVLLFTRRALTRQILSDEPMSGRLGDMLRALRAGDTLLGLTSCSGHSAFTDPGPPAQRR